VGDAEMPWGILGKTLYKFVSRAAEKQVERSIENLKSFLER